MLRHIVGFLGQLFEKFEQFKSKIFKKIKMKNQNEWSDSPVKGWIKVGVVCVVATLASTAIAFSLPEAPSRLEVAEKAYSEANHQLKHWEAKEKETRCDLASIKIADHESLNLPAGEIERLSKVLQACEGK